MRGEAGGRQAGTVSRRCSGWRIRTIGRRLAASLPDHYSPLLQPSTLYPLPSTLPHGAAVSLSEIGPSLPGCEAATTIQNLPLVRLGKLRVPALRPLVGRQETGLDASQMRPAPRSGY